MSKLTLKCLIILSKQTEILKNKYELWRVLNKTRVYPQIKADILSYAQLKDYSLADLEKDGILTINSSVTRNGRDYVIKLPDDLGENYKDKICQVLWLKRSNFEMIGINKIHVVCMHVCKYINMRSKEKFNFLFFLANPFSLYNFIQSVKQSVFRKPN